MLGGALSFSSQQITDKGIDKTRPENVQHLLKKITVLFQVTDLQMIYSYQIFCQSASFLR